MKRGAGWPIGIVTILGLTVAANIWIFTVAGADPSFAIEPDYYAKAVRWDSTLAQAKENARLGWRLEPTLAAFDARSGARLDVSLVDSAGTPIADAEVTVSALYNARADRIYQATLARSTDRYSGTIPVAHAGQWELRFEVQRGGQRFTSTSRVEATVARKS